MIINVRVGKDNLSALRPPSTARVYIYIYIYKHTYISLSIYVYTNI